MNFVENLSKSAKSPLKLSNSDLGSQTGQNIGFLLAKHSEPALVDLIRKNVSLKKQVINPLPDDEKWKAGMIEELVLVKKGFLGAEFALLAAILEYLCTK